MSIHKLPISRTITLSAVVTGTLLTIFRSLGGGDGNFPVRQGEVYWTALWGTEGTPIAGVSGFVRVSSYSNGDGNFTVTDTVSAWAIDVATPTSQEIPTTHYNTPDIAREYGTDFHDCAATASISVLADLYMETGIASGPLVGDDEPGELAPDYGGSSMESTVASPGYERVRFFWAARPGATMTATVTDAYATATDTYVIGATPVELPRSAVLTVRGYVVVGTGTQDMAITGTLDGGDLKGDATTTTRATGTCEASAGASVSAGNARVTSKITCWPDRVANIRYGINAMNVAYPATLTVRRSAESADDDGIPTYSNLTVSNGRGTETLTQRRFTFGWYYEESPIVSGSHVVNEHSPFAAYLANPAAAGEDAYDWRMMIRGKRYAAWEVSQDAEQALDGSYSGTTPITRTLDPIPRTIGYRYLDISGLPVGETAVLSITGALDILGSVTRAYQATVDGSGKARFDLCSPYGETALYDGTDSRWKDLDETVGTAKYMGLDSISAYTITCGDVTVPAGGVALVRADHSTLHAMNTWRQWVKLTYTSGETWDETLYVRRFLQGDTDGRLSLEECQLFKTVRNDSGGRHVTYVNHTIGTLLGEIEPTRNPSWNAALAAAIDVSDGADYSDLLYGYCNKNRPGAWLCGDGLMHNGTDWDAAGVTGVGVNTSATIYAQELFDQVTDWPHKAGDALQVGIAGDNLTICVGKVLDAGAWGIVVDQDGAPAAGVQVDLLQGATDRGSGTTDATYGEYHTGTPFGKGEAAHVIRPHSKAQSVTIDAQHFHRSHWWRGSFRTSAVLEHRALTVDSPRSWLHVSEANVVRTYHMATWTQAFVSTAETAVDYWHKLRTDARKGVLYLLGWKG